MTRLEERIRSGLHETAERIPDPAPTHAARRFRSTRPAGVWVAVAAVAAVLVLFTPILFLGGSDPGTTPAGDPPSPFLDTWVSIDGDGSLQTMVIEASGDEAVEIVVHDDFASVCSGAPSTMTGSGGIEGDNELVLPSPVLTCDDGSRPQALSGPPLEEQLRNFTFVLDPGTDTLTDNFGFEWTREGAEDPSPEPTISDSMWPQSSMEEVQEAQDLAHAGDPEYAWQVDPRLSSEEWWGYLQSPGAEIVERFLREEMGWDQFLFNPYQGDDGDGAADGMIRGVVYLRCAPGGTNPLYPIAPEGHQEAPGAESCAPTIDEFRYETVSLDLAQPDRRGGDGIWVVSGWRVTAPFAQADPEVVEANATARLEDFLRARLAGEGAEGYVNIGGGTVLEEVSLLYATSTGARYERYQIERVSEPVWPHGEMEFIVRLFAEGGQTVVEQPISLTSDGSLWSDATTENGRPVAVPYDFFDGQVTLYAAHPWEETWANHEGLIREGGDIFERIQLLTDPTPVGTGCQAGLAQADAETLAESIRSDPDLETTTPEPVNLGGARGLWMDVVAATGASVCDYFPATMVLSSTENLPSDLGLDPAERMRLYLFDLPEGLSTRILAVAVVAPDAGFEDLLEAAAPIIESIEFHTGGN